MSRLRNLPPREKWGRNAARAAFLAIPLILLVLAYLVGHGQGVRDGALKPAPTPQASDPAADAFAARFATDYLTYDSSRQDDYRARVSPYLAQGLDSGSLWDGSGKQWVGQALVVADRIDGSVAGTRTVTIAAQLDTSRWVYVGVPVVARNGGYALAGQPALLPPPAKAPYLIGQTADRPVDGDLQQRLRPDLSSFFTAYADGDTASLGYITAPGHSVGSLGGAVHFTSLQALTVYAGHGNEREARASVQWKTPAGATLTQAYRLQLQEFGGKWLVAEIAPAVGGMQ